MEKIIPGKTIILNKNLNTTFIANDCDINILEKRNGKFEWDGELSIGVVEKEYKQISEDLYKIINDLTSDPEVINKVNKMLTYDENGKLVINDFYPKVL